MDEMSLSEMKLDRVVRGGVCRRTQSSVRWWVDAVTSWFAYSLRSRAERLFWFSVAPAPNFVVIFKLFSFSFGESNHCVFISTSNETIISCSPPFLLITFLDTLASFISSLFVFLGHHLCPSSTCHIVKLTPVFSFNSTRRLT